jgi:uncharacterized protein YbjT (DUF2867 family)
VRALSRRKEQAAALEGLVEEWWFGDQYDPAVQARLVVFFDRHGRHEALRRGLGAANYLAGLLSADGGL